MILRLLKVLLSLKNNILLNTNTALPFVVMSCFFWSCTSKAEEFPIPNFIQPHQIVHRGVFSNDQSTYYFVVSDTNFEQFDIWQTERRGSKWSDPHKAIFNSDYNDHGLSFSPDGSQLYFSSTRPVDSLLNTWHLWKSEKLDTTWSEPELVIIPNLMNRLLSHPTITPDGTLYFHLSDLDYSDMRLFSAKPKGSGYENARELVFDELSEKGITTPYVSADGQYIVFAVIEPNMSLYVAESTGNDSWSIPVKFPDSIIQKSQGNPYLLPDISSLLYASEKVDQWVIEQVPIVDFLNRIKE